MIEAVQQNFLNPLGLTALLSLIPLIIFYLVRPKPEREVMPSMTFFSQEKQEGKIKNALRKLKRNKFLPIHILFILIASAAIANPIISGLETEGTSVIIIDNSASMNDNTQQAREFAKKHLGETNTVISAGAKVKVLGRNMPPEQARKRIENVKNQGSRTDLVSATQLATNYNGKIVLASDMDHNSNGNLETLLEKTAEDREVKLMDLNHKNRHAFTQLDVEGKSADITVQNFVNEDRNITVSTPSGSREIRVEGKSTKTFTEKMDSGTHELSLPPDELALDNNLYVSIPENNKIDVKRLGDENKYFRTAVNLINHTRYFGAGSIGSSDIYYISDDYDLTDNRINMLKDELEIGKGIVFEPRENLPDFAPVENRSNVRERQVQIDGSIVASFTSDVTSYDVKGKSLSSPEEAIVLSGDKQVMLYNVNDEIFGQQITYPIFWKKNFLRMSNTVEASQLNLETGTRKAFKNTVTHRGEEFQGETVIGDTGFYRGEKTYAVNLLKAEESAPYLEETLENSEESKETGKDPARKYLLAALALIATLEIAALTRGGALQ